LTSVRDATLDVARTLGLTTWFGNPGSTEIPLLADLPDDIHYVLALHENAAVSAAAGYALGSGRPVLVSLHTTAGFGNAVSAIATARVNRAPLVILVGQQDRRHLLNEPFLTGRLVGLAGDYPVATIEPPRAQDVPGALAQAAHAATTASGPCIVVVPMDDWDAEMDDTPTPAPSAVVRATGVAATDVAAVVALLDTATRPAIVTGAGADSVQAWASLVDLADRLGCPVFHEPFTARAGFPQDHPRFAGFLPAGRAALRQVLEPYDVVLVVGAALLRQYHFESGGLLPAATRAAVISADPAEVHRSPAAVGVIAPVPAAVHAVTLALAPRSDAEPATVIGRADTLRAQCAERAVGMTPETLFAELARRLDDDTVIVEESPSSRDALQLMVATRKPLGFLSAAMGGLGFGIPATIGLRMACPDRPVIAVIGDGSSVYCIQALWTAATYGVGVVFFIMDNSHYLVMERLTAKRGKPPWPSLASVSVDAIATGFGARAVSVATPDQLTALLDDVVPSLRSRNEPLVVNVELEAQP
jgi:benzoylformate decarboxylase